MIPSLAPHVRELNDAFRRTGPAAGGRWLLTQGILGLGAGFVARAVGAVQGFAGFDGDNDPHGEHDFGSVDVCGTKLFWKIDYYDLDLEFGSEDPADTAITTRVLTIRLAEEY